MTLEAKIQQLIGLGEKDPLVIARKVIEQNDSKWLSAELLALAEDVIAEIARHRVGTERRGAQVALRPGDHVASGELKLKSQWVPGDGWLRASDVTAAQGAKIASFYRRLAHGSLVRASWWDEVVAMMVDEGAKTLGRLKAPLPPLPDELELDEAGNYQVLELEAA